MTRKFVSDMWRWRTIRAAALALAGAAFLGTALIAGAGPKPPPGPPPPSPVSRGVLLDPANRPEVYNKLPPEKRAALDRENQLRNQALQHPLSGRKPGDGSTDGRLPPSTPHPGGEYRAAGAGTLVQNACGEQFKGSDLNTNHWTEKLAEKSYLVCAGAQKGEPAQGTLYITVGNAKGSAELPKDQQLPVSWFPTPRKAGEVTITDAVGEVLTLRAKDGTLFYFDVGSLKYVDGPPKPAAEKTPTP
jgi:hypothetical protein